MHDKEKGFLFFSLQNKSPIDMSKNKQGLALKCMVGSDGFGELIRYFRTFFYEKSNLKRPFQWLSKFNGHGYFYTVH